MNGYQNGAFQYPIGSSGGGGGLASPIGLGDLPGSGIDPGVLLYIGGAWTIVDPSTVPGFDDGYTLLLGHGGNLGAGVILKGADGVSMSDAGPRYDVPVTLKKISVDVRTAAPAGTDYLISVMDKTLTTTYGSVTLAATTTGVSSAALAAVIPANTPFLVIATRTVGAGQATTMAVTVEVEK